MDDNQFKRLLDILDLSWPGYRQVRKGIKKRISRHMEQTGCRSVDEYLSKVGSMPETKLLMTVSVSHFFRDHSLWKALEKKVIPEILNQNHNSVRVWCAGCALGQEVYSFKMLWESMENTYGTLPSLFLVATDVNPDYLSRAINGIYDAGNIRAVPDDIREKSLKLTGDRYAVSDRLKNNISWSICDLTDPPVHPDLFQIIFLRNSLLTYYNQNVQEAALPRIIRNLVEGGYLIIGLKERVPSGHPYLKRSDAHPCIFQK